VCTGGERGLDDGLGFSRIAGIKKFL